ncbi:MAG: translation initiation factor IF-2 N-terminal domain-containing protein, partial [Bryobacteraceae bacterium]
MKKIRINELARELEVKPGVILDLLPEFGVSEKKTHSSSIDEDVALSVRHRLFGENGEVHRQARAAESAAETMEHSEHAETSVAVAEPPEEEPEPQAKPVTPEAPRPAAPMQPPLRAPVRDNAPTAEPRSLGPRTPEHAPTIPPAPAAPAPPQPVTEAERHKVFQPLRPPIHSAGAIHPPLAPASQAQPSGLMNRTLSVPARPIAPPLIPGQPLTGPRQPLPPESPRSAPALPQRPAAPAPPARPAPSVPVTATPEAPRPTRPPQTSNIPPTHVVLPGPAPAGPSAVPGAPVPRPAAPARPANLAPNTPIAPRPQGTRLVG